MNNSHREIMRHDYLTDRSFLETDEIALECMNITYEIMKIVIFMDQQWINKIVIDGMG